MDHEFQTFSRQIIVRLRNTGLLHFVALRLNSMPTKWQFLHLDTHPTRVADHKISQASCKNDRTTSTPARHSPHSQFPPPPSPLPSPLPRCLAHIGDQMPPRIHGPDLGRVPPRRERANVTDGASGPQLGEVVRVQLARRDGQSLTNYDRKRWQRRGKNQQGIQNFIL